MKRLKIRCRCKGGSRLNEISRIAKFYSLTLSFGCRGWRLTGNVLVRPSFALLCEFSKMCVVSRFLKAISFIIVDGCGFVA